MWRIKTKKEAEANPSDIEYYGHFIDTYSYMHGRYYAQNDYDINERVSRKMPIHTARVSNNEGLLEAKVFGDLNIPSNWLVEDAEIEF